MENFYDRIDYVKIALMEKDSNKLLLDKDKKENFIIKHSAKLDIPSLRKIKEYKELDPDEMTEVVSMFLNSMYYDLCKSIKENDEIESIGIWINSSKIQVDNSMDISILNDIKKYGDEDIDPLTEFYKMTLDKYQNF